MSSSDLPGLSATGFFAGLSGASAPGVGPGGAMSGLGGAGVRSAIAQAAQASGVDFSYLLAQARLESGMNPNARAATSSAQGLYQFTNATWAQTLARHGAALGLSRAALADPSSNAQLMALRNDPQASALMAAAMAGDNQAVLSGALGRAPQAGELYLAHFLGADGAVKFLSGLASDPAQSAAALLPKAAAANHAVFFDASGTPRSLGQMMALINTRLATAMQDGGQDQGDGGIESLAAAGSGGLGALVWGEAGAIAPVPLASSSGSGPAETTPTGGPIAQEFAQIAAQAGAASGPGSSSVSMAETLRATFGSDAPAASPNTPGFVRSAYGRLAALGF